MTTEELEVLLGDTHVGWLRQSSYRVTFTLSDTYLETNPRPVLGQWYEDRLRKEPYVEPLSGLPAFFENLLPSHELRLLIRVQHQLDAPTDLDLLAVVGEDLPGATVLRDPRQRSPVGFEDAPPLDLSDEVDADVRPLRFSLAGLQLKFSLVKQGRVLTLPAKGEHGRLIAKVPTARAPPGIVEDEESMMRWAKTAGFEVPRTEIRRARELQGLPHRMARDTPIYVIERYDRKGPVRVHQEDFAQIIGILTEDAVSSIVPFGYGALGRIVRHVLGESGVEEYLRRLALMIASGNGDAHIKNWSVVYPNGITPRWAMDRRAIRWVRATKARRPATAIRLAIR